MTKVIIRLLLIVCAITSLTACQKIYDSKRGLFQGSADELYQQAGTALAKGSYEKAVRYYESFDAKYPFNAHSKQAHLEVIYVYYMAGDSASAVAASDRYIHLYPRDAHLDYVYYMRAIANYSQNVAFFSNYANLDPAWRDIHPLHQSFDDLRLLLRRFPHSAYANDARQRMIYLRNVFAEYEMNIAHYYMQHHAYVAASNRASYVVKHYSQAPALEDALHVLAKANAKLGLHQSEHEALLMLNVNHPHG